MANERSRDGERFAARLWIGAVLISALAVAGCGGTSAASAGAATDAAETGAAARIDESRSYFVIAGNEEAAANPKVTVLLDPGNGEGLFDDGIGRYELRLLPQPLGSKDLTVWIANLRTDTAPGRIEVTDSLTTPTVLVGVGRGLLKGYMEVISGHLVIEELGEQVSLAFEAELESQSMLDKERQGRRVKVRGRVVGAKPAV